MRRVVFFNKSMVGPYVRGGRPVAGYSRPGDGNPHYVHDRETNERTVHSDRPRAVRAANSLYGGGPGRYQVWPVGKDPEYHAPYKDRNGGERHEYVRAGYEPRTPEVDAAMKKVGRALDEAYPWGYDGGGRDPEYDRDR